MMMMCAIGDLFYESIQDLQKKVKPNRQSIFFHNKVANWWTEENRFSHQEIGNKLT
jgi:hypothetical protein